MGTGVAPVISAELVRLGGSSVLLAVRLFGNMMSHQVIVAVILLILPLIVPALLEIFGLFIGAIQAYIFTILTIVYIGGAVRAGGEFS